MTIKRALLITLLSASVIGLLALGFKTNSFSKENIKNSFKLQENSTSKKRNTPIRVNAEDNETDLEQKTSTYQTVLTANGTIQNYTQYKYQFSQDNQQQQSITDDFANIKYSSYNEYTQSQALTNGYNLHHYAIYEINNYKYTTYKLTDTQEISFVPTLSPTGQSPSTITASVYKRAYLYENLINDNLLFNLQIPTMQIIAFQNEINNNNAEEYNYIEDSFTYTTNTINQGPQRKSQTIDTNLDNFYITRGTTMYVLIYTQITLRNITANSIQFETPIAVFNAKWSNPVVNQEVVPIVPMMFDILTMPFSFITTAFNVTLWEGTPYQFNFSNFILSLIAIATLLFIIKLFTSGMGVIGNYTGKINNNIEKSKKSKPQKAKKEKKE